MSRTNINRQWTHLIAADMPVDDDWAFATTLSQECGHTFHTVWCDGRAGVPRPKRWLRYIDMAWRLLRHRGHLQVVVCWQQFFGIVYALICSLLPIKPTFKLVVMTFIYKPRKGVTGRLQHWCLRRAINSGHISRLVVYTPAEAEAYSRMLTTDMQLFVYAPLALGEPVPAVEIADDGYFFAAGASNRDYATLIQAVTGTSLPLTIVCDSLKTPAAANITLHRHTFGHDMLRLMARSRAVVITLDNPLMSSGQLVALQAMALSKPLIVTRGTALEPYAAHNVNALLTDQDTQSLRQALQRLADDPALAHTLGEAGHQRYVARHTPEALARSITKWL